MAILIDGANWAAGGRMWSHLVSDTALDELHAFAVRLGVPPRAFDRDHYDVPAELHQRAIRLGAKPVASQDLVAALITSGLRRRRLSRLAPPR